MLAAIFNSVMDNLAHHWYKSVFNKLNPQFYNPEISWANKSKVWAPVSDCWHVCKSLMLTCLILAVVLYKPMVNWYVDFGILGGAWIIIFNLFYNRILIRKQ